MDHVLSIHKSSSLDSTSHSPTGGGTVPTQNDYLLLPVSAHSDSQLGLVTSDTPLHAAGVKVKNIAQDPWCNHSDISNIVSKIKESNTNNKDNLVLHGSVEKKISPSFLRASSFFQDTSGQYSIDNPSYAGGGWGSVGGVITSVIGLDTLFSGNWTSPGHVAHDYRGVFVSNSADIGNNMIGRPLNDAENQKYGDIVHDRVKHCIKHMGFKNGPSQGWDEAMGIILPDLAHSQAAKDYLNSLYQSALNMPISDNALNADMNALANKQASMFEIRSDVTHSAAEQEVIAGFYKNLANYSASDGQIHRWEDALANGSATYDSMRDVIGHGGEARNGVIGLYSRLANVSVSEGQIQGWQNVLANGSATYDSMRDAIGHGGETRNGIIGLYSGLANVSVSEGQIQGWQNVLANGSATYDSMRDAIGHGGEARNGIIGLYSGLANVSVSEGQIQGWQNVLANGSATYDSMRDVIGHGGEARNAIIGLYSSLANVTATEQDIQNWQGVLANGSATYDSMRYGISHGWEAQGAITGLYSSLTNAAATEQDVQSWQGVLANGSATYDSMRYGIAHGWEAQGSITGLYASLANVTATEQDIQNWQSALANGSATYDSMRYDISHGWEAQGAITGLYSSLTNVAATEQDVQSWQGYLANGSATYEKMRYTIGHGWEASNAIAGLYSSLANVTASEDQIHSWQEGLGNGSDKYSDVRYEIGHGWETRAAINGFYSSFANVTASEAQIKSWQDGLGNGSITYNDVKYDIGHGWEAGLALKTTFQFTTGEQMDDATLKQYEDNMTASGSLNTTDSEIVHSSLALTQLQTVYDEWGQLPPDSGALQNAEIAIYNLSHAWIVVAQQKTSDWVAEASAYQAIAGTASYGQLVENISISMQQATSLLASALSDPLMNAASTSEDFRNIVVKGGASLFEAVIDQEDVENNIQAVRQEGDGTPCEPANFKKAHSQDVLNCQIAAVNATPGLYMAGQATDKWANGIQWRSAGGNPQQQGNPFEVWDAQRLKKEGYEWLADYNADRSNWKAFDAWDSNTQVAVSDKTIDLKASSYQVMYKIQGRLLSDVEAMLRYQRDGGFYRYNDDSGKVGKQVSFERDNISHYVLDLGVPSEPTADQWKAICLALQKAKKRVALQPDTAMKTIDFQVKDVI